MRRMMGKPTIVLRCPVCGGEEEVTISSPRTPLDAVVEESFCCVPCAGRGTSAQSGVRWFDANGNEVFPPLAPEGTDGK